jgi:hypothetical protein
MITPVLYTGNGLVCDERDFFAFIRDKTADEPIVAFIGASFTRRIRVSKKYLCFFLFNSGIQFRKLCPIISCDGLKDKGEKRT